MGHPAVPSRDNDAHRSTDREELTTSREPSEVAAAVSQKRTPRTDRLYRKDQARLALRHAQEKQAENASLLSRPHAPQEPRHSRALLQYPVQPRAT
jgi:hypothetical protein